MGRQALSQGPTQQEQGKKSDSTFTNTPLVSNRDALGHMQEPSVFSSAASFSQAPAVDRSGLTPLSNATFSDGPIQAAKPATSEEIVQGYDEQELPEQVKTLAALAGISSTYSDDKNAKKYRNEKGAYQTLLSRPLTKEFLAEFTKQKSNSARRLVNAQDQKQAEYQTENPTASLSVAKGKGLFAAQQSEEMRDYGSYGALLNDLNEQDAHMFTLNDYLIGQRDLGDTYDEHQENHPESPSDFSAYDPELAERLSDMHSAKEASPIISDKNDYGFPVRQKDHIARRKALKKHAVNFAKTWTRPKPKSEPEPKKKHFWSNWFQ